MTPQEFFKKDRLADNVGVGLVEIEEGYDKTRLIITEEHLSVGNRTQGGTLFTLTDLTLAIAVNSHDTLTFSLSSSITFLRSSDPRDTLYAEAHGRYTGCSTGYYQTDIISQEGELIATFKFSTFRRGDTLPSAVPLQEGRDYSPTTGIIGQWPPLTLLRKTLVEPEFRYIPKRMGR